MARRKIQYKGDVISPGRRKDYSSTMLKELVFKKIAGKDYGESKYITRRISDIIVTQTIETMVDIITNCNSLELRGFIKINAIPKKFYFRKLGRSLFTQKVISKISPMINKKLRRNLREEFLEQLSPEEVEKVNELKMYYDSIKKRNLENYRKKKLLKQN